VRAPARRTVELDEMLARREMRSKKLAERIGLSEQQVSMLRCGRARGVRFDTLARICEVLGCQPGDLLVQRAGDPIQD
jgi:putative transcriptional regulator